MKLKVHLSTDDSERVFLLKQSRGESETAGFRDSKRLSQNSFSVFFPRF